MSDLFLNQVTLAIFAFLTLSLGLYVRGARNIKDYITGGSDLGTGVIFISLLSTFLCTKDLFLKGAFRGGDIVLVCVVCCALTTFLIGFFLLPNLVHYKAYNLGMLFEQMYGKVPGRVVTLLGFLSSLFFIVGQMRFVSQIAPLETLGISEQWLLIGIAVLVTIYMLSGGMRSIMITDFFQFIVVAIGLTIFFFFVFNNKQPLLMEGAQIEQHTFFFSPPSPFGFSLALFFWAIWPNLVLFPPMMQRLLLIKRKEQIRHTFLGISILYFLIGWLFYIAGVYLARRIPSFSVKLLTQSYLLEQAGIPTLGKLSLLLVTMALMISTIDSFLNSMSIDIVLIAKNYYGDKISEQRYLFWSRVVTFAVSILAISFTLLSRVKPNELIGYSYIIMGFVFLLLAAALLGWKGNAKIFWWVFSLYYGSLLLSFGILYFLVDKEKLLGFIKGDWGKTYPFRVAYAAWFLSIIFTTLAFPLIHYLSWGKQWVWYRKRGMWEGEERWKLQWNCQFLRHPALWAQKQVDRYGRQSYLLGIFIYSSCLLPYFSTDPLLVHNGWIIGLRSIGVLWATFLLLEEQWPASIKAYFDLYYYVAIFYCVPFTAVMTSFQDPKGVFTISNLVLGMILLIVLVNWRVFIAYALSSLLLAACFYQGMYGSWWPDFGVNGGMVLSFNLLYGALVCLLFARKQQGDTQQKKLQLLSEAQRQQKLLAIQTKAHQQLVSVVDAKNNVMQHAHKTLQKLATNEEIAEADVQLLKHAFRYLEEIKEASLAYFPLQTEKITLQQLLNNLQKAAKQQELILEELSIVCRLPQDTWLKGDCEELVQLLMNGFSYLLSSYKGNYQLHLDQVRVRYGQAASASSLFALRCSIVATGVNVPTKKNYPYLKASNKKLYEDRRLEANQQIIQLHCGAMELSRSCQSYVIPFDLEAAKQLLKEENSPLLTK